MIEKKVNGVRDSSDEAPQELDRMVESSKNVCKKTKRHDYFGKGKLLQIVTNPEIQLESLYALPRFEMIDRRCYISGEIDEEISLDIMEKIQFWNSQDFYDDRCLSASHPIMIYINSTGGDLTETFQIIDVIKGSKVPVYTVVTGCAMSGAFLIAVAGHKRFGFQHSSYMLHEGACGCEPLEAHKFLQHAENYEKVLKQIRDLILEDTNITQEEYDNNKKNDWYFEAQEAVKYGIIDEIVTDVNGGIFYEK